MTEAQEIATCEKIWKVLRRYEPQDAWGILAMLIERFCLETDDDSRDAFVDWLQRDRGLDYDGPLH